jgi:hypothetical protein
MIQLFFGEEEIMVPYLDSPVSKSSNENKSIIAGVPV